MDKSYDGLVSLFPQMRLVAIPCYVPKMIATLTLINLTICSSYISHIFLMAKSLTNFPAVSHQSGDEMSRYQPPNSEYESFLSKKLGF